MPYGFSGARRVDANHSEILDQARALGMTVIDTHALGAGNPDAIILWRGRGWQIEIKVEGGDLTPAEKRYALASKEPVPIIRSFDDLLKLTKAIR